MEEHCLLACFHGLHSLLSHTSQNDLLRGSIAHSGLALSHQPLIQKVPHTHTCLQAGGGFFFFIFIYLFPSDSSLCQVGKKLTHWLYTNLMSSVNPCVLKDQEDEDEVSHPCTFKEQPHCMWTHMGEIVHSRQGHGILLSVPTAQAGAIEN